MPVVLCSAVRVLGQLRTRPRETRATTSVRCTVTVGFFERRKKNLRVALTKGKLWTLSSRRPQTTIKLNSCFDHPHEKTQPAEQRVPREHRCKPGMSCTPKR